MISINIGNELFFIYSIDGYIWPMTCNNKLIPLISILILFQISNHFYYDFN